MNVLVARRSRINYLFDTDKKMSRISNIKKEKRRQCKAVSEYVINNSHTAELTGASPVNRLAQVV